MIAGAFAYFFASPFSLNDEDREARTESFGSTDPMGTFASPHSRKWRTAERGIGDRNE